MKQLRYVLLLPLMCVSIGIMAQDSTAFYRARKDRADSLSKIEQKRSATLSELKFEKNETQVKAAEAQRVERNTSDAARESKIAYRSEQRAQKARTKADKQAKKAAKARDKSDN